MWAIFIGSHLTREPTGSPVLAKWGNLELMLATNFGNLCQTVTKVSSKNFGYQIWFCTRLTIFKVSEWFCIYFFLSEGSLVWFIAASGIQYDAPLALWKTILSDALYWNLHRWVEMCNAEKEVTLLLSLFSKRNYKGELWLLWVQSLIYLLFYSLKRCMQLWQYSVTMNLVIAALSCMLTFFL